jgi:hypothetical protein
MIYSTAVTADAVHKSNPSFANPAVAHCCKAWQKTFREIFAVEGVHVTSAARAGEAYRAAMPALSTRDGCRDFIACVAQAMLIGVISDKDAGKLLYAAQVALAAANVDGNLPAAPDLPHPASSRKPKGKRSSNR